MSVTRRFGYADVRPLLDRFVSALRDETEGRLLGVALYGSVARDEARPESDIDLLTVHEDDRFDAMSAAIAAKRTVEDDARRLREAGVPSRINTVPMRERFFRETPWLLLDICHHGIILFDPRGLLLARLAALRSRLEELGAQRIEHPDGFWYWDLKPDMRPGEIVEIGPE